MNLMVILTIVFHRYIILRGSNLTSFCQFVCIDFLSAHFQESILLLSLPYLQQLLIFMILIFLFQKMKYCSSSYKNT